MNVDSYRVFANSVDYKKVPDKVIISSLKSFIGSEKY